MPKKKQHRHDRKSGGFEKHQAPKSTRETGSGLGRKWAWQLLAAFRRNQFFGKAHIRSMSRAAALPGKHVRRVEEPVRSTHGKSGL